MLPFAIVSELVPFVTMGEGTMAICSSFVSVVGKDELFSHPHSNVMIK